MREKYTVVFVTPEMMMPELSEPACGANFRGGLGILAGDIMEGLAIGKIDAIGIAPFYNRHWLSKEKIFYGEPVFQLTILGQPMDFYKVHRGGTDVYCPKIPGVLYTSDRGKRLYQEVLLAHSVLALLKKLGKKPDIVWLNEGHTATVIPLIKEDPFWGGTKFLFTTHTPVPEGMEKFFGLRFDEMRIHEKYRPIFVKNGQIDMTWASMVLSDKVNAVSQEHGEITKKMFPEFRDKITSVTNGSSRSLWLSENTKEIGEKAGKYNLWNAFCKNKLELVDFLESYSKVRFKMDKPILAWVRRLAWYKNQCPMLSPIISVICAERGQEVETEVGCLQGLGFQIFAAGVAHESDSVCLGWMGHFHHWMKNSLKGKFIFLPEYNLELLKQGAHGSDVWLSCPMPGNEACGTSEQRATINGIPNLTTRGGGAKEYVQEFDFVERKGNGFFIEPYSFVSIYHKLRAISDLYYDWMKNSRASWLDLKMNALETGKTLGVDSMIKNYEKIFRELLKK